MIVAIKAVVTDFGGVLVRTEDPRGRQKWEEILGLRPGDLAHEVFESGAAVRATTGEVPESAVWQSVGSAYKLDESQLRQLQVDFWSGDQLDSLLVDFLHSLRPRYKTAILSNAWSGARRAFTQSYHLDEAVDQIIISAEEKLAKPDQRFYQLAADRLGVTFKLRL